MSTTHPRLLKPKQKRSPGYFQNRKHVSFIMTPEDYQRLQFQKRKLSHERKEKVSMSEVIRLLIETMCDDPSFLFESPPVKRGTRFDD